MIVSYITVDSYNYYDPEVFFFNSSEIVDGKKGDAWSANFDFCPDISHLNWTFGGAAVVVVVEKHERIHCLLTTPVLYPLIFLTSGENCASL